MNRELYKSQIHSDGDHGCIITRNILVRATTVDEANEIADQLATIQGQADVSMIKKQSSCKMLVSAN